MNLKKLLTATIVVGVVANVYDFLVHSVLLDGTYSAHPALFNQGPPVGWFIFGDFVFAFIFLWLYDKFAGTLGAGPKAGAMFGLYAGLLVNFPTWLLMSVMFVGFPYSLSWIWTIAGIVWYVLMGAVAGAVYKKGAPAAA